VFGLTQKPRFFSEPKFEPRDSKITKSHLISDFEIPATSVDANAYLPNLFKGICSERPFDGAFEPKKEV